jgi:hypothetical protein
MNHAIEYFHTLVEEDFSRDQYDVCIKDGKYFITITLKSVLPSALTRLKVNGTIEKMERCISLYIHKDNYRLYVITEPVKISENIKKNYERYY